MPTPDDLEKILDANQALRELYEAGVFSSNGGGGGGSPNIGIFWGELPQWVSLLPTIEISEGVFAAGDARSLGYMTITSDATLNIAPIVQIPEFDQGSLTVISLVMIITSHDATEQLALGVTDPLDLASGALLHHDDLGIDELFSTGTDLSYDAETGLGHSVAGGQYEFTVFAILQVSEDFVGSAGSSGGITTIPADDEDVVVPAQAGTTIVLYTALTAPRTVTFPPAGGRGQEIIIVDAQNLATGVNTITPVAVGDDTISGSPIGQTRFDGIGQALRFANVVTDDAGNFWAEITGVSPAMQQLLGSLGGTDGDGNVYSIEYDPDADPVILAIHCVTPDGVESIARVRAGAAELDCLDAEGTTEGLIHVEPGNAKMQALGDGFTHTVEIDSGGINLDGVVIDPTAPWPGG